MSYGNFYGISMIHRDTNYNYISKVKQHRISNNDVDEMGTFVDRRTVVSNLQGRIPYVTIIPNGYQEWRKGADVHLIEASGYYYIRTDANRVASDNLGSLPEF